MMISSNLNQSLKLNSIYTGLAMAIASIPTLVIVPLMLLQAGFDAHGAYLSICVAMALTSFMAVKSTGLPLLIGPQIAGVSYLVGHLHQQLGWDASMLAYSVLASTFFFFLAIALDFPKKLMEAFGSILQRSITAALGAFFMVLTLRSLTQLPPSVLGVDSEYSWMLSGLLVVLFPCLGIEWLQRRGFASAMIWGMVLSFILGYAIFLQERDQAAMVSNPWSWTWVPLDQIIDQAGGYSNWIWGVFGLWIIQTLDVAGCSIGMVDLAANRMKERGNTQGEGWPIKMPSMSKIQLMAPLGTLLGFCGGLLGSAGPFCVHLSSATAFCTRAPHHVFTTGLVASGVFLIAFVFKGVLLSLPIYLSSCVVLWVGFAMLKQLPVHFSKGTGDVVAGWLMVLAVFVTGRLLDSMAIGVWVATVLGLIQSHKIHPARWLLSTLFVFSKYLS